jgi:hypothetical protein
MTFSRFRIWALLNLALAASGYLCAQGVAPYPNAITDQSLHTKKTMAPPAVNVSFHDPDFGSQMVRVTDSTTDPKHAFTYFRNADNETNMFSSDVHKFFVVNGNGGLLAFGFNPSSMLITSLPGVALGTGLRVPLRTGATFSFVDPDLMYGADPKNPLSISGYRFSSGMTNQMFDATMCGTEPALLVAPRAVIGDVTISGDDSRIAVTAGGTQFGDRAFVIVYDQKSGCRWYNTQTGKIGGQWGTVGKAAAPMTFAIRHAHISGGGRYVKISVDHVGFFIWDVGTLNVHACYVPYGPSCDGYGSLGKNAYINAHNNVDDMDTLKRSLGTIKNFVHLVDPLPSPHNTGMERHFTWSNGHLKDTAPVCGSTYPPDGPAEIKQPYDSEIFCAETDGLKSTVWRFAHHRATWDPEYFWSEPFGNISIDGRFFLFSSSWDGQVGSTLEGDPRSDVWILKLE